MNSILVLRGGALGDFLVTLPLLRALRGKWPAARIELAGNKRAAELAVLDGALDATHGQAEARWARLYSTEPLEGAFRDWLESFDLILSYWPDPDNELAAHFPLRPGQSFRSADAAIASRPASAHFFGAVTEWGIPRPPENPPLSLPPSLQHEADGRLMGHQLCLAIHPGSGSTRKNWPAERWCQLIEELAPQPVLIVLGEAESGAKSRFMALASRRIQIADQWALPILAGALRRCRLFIGHDTGLGHLAAAVGTPCVLLFGPTDPAVWAPPGRGIQVVTRGPTLDDISVTDVLSHVASV